MRSRPLSLCLSLLAACSSQKSATPTPSGGDAAPPPACGDQVRAGDELCDGTDLAGETCLSLGFDGGDLACGGACTFDTSACTGTGPSCGDDDATGDEACDGADLRGETCNTLKAVAIILPTLPRSRICCARPAT